MHIKPLALVRLKGAFQLLAATALLATSQHLSAQEDWPKGIDPSSLLLNTEPEPDLNAKGFVSLFNGKNLNGWEVLGSQMEFRVEDGDIVGTCTPNLKPNSFLCTTENYDDFIFTTEFKWDVLGNSGVMFRADAKKPDENGSRRVFGYQAEMDPGERAWTGGIYGEVMKGWKYPLSREVGHAAARAAVNLEEWNRLTIYASGNTIRTWVNGVPCAFLINDERDSGFIGLQVHSGNKGTIRWRNIKIKEIDAAPSWTDLFESGDFSQWTHYEGGPVKDGWSYKDGVVHRGGKDPGDIITRETFKDFEMVFDWKISDAGNSGVKYRTKGRFGLEYQILDDKRHSDGEDPDHRVGSIYELKRAAHDKPVRPVGEWNNARIVVEDDLVTHYMNGEQIAQIKYGSDEWDAAFKQSKYDGREGFGGWKGPILLQDHHDEVWFRNLRIRPL